MEFKQAQVLIAGGGPTGMVLAYALALKGVSVHLLEANTDCLEDMRASTFHPPTLEMMAELGIVDTLEEQGLKAPIYQYYNRQSGANFRLDLSEIGDVTSFPYRLQCEQFKLTRLLAEKLAALPNAEVDFARRVVHIEQSADGIIAHAEGPYDLMGYRADYLVGADGANSIVRKWLGIDFDGFTYPESFLTLSTTYPLERHLNWLSDVNYVADPPEWCVLLRVPGLWRVLVPQNSSTVVGDLLGDETKDRVFRRLIGDAASGVKTEHRTLYRVHQRVAKTFRVGRALLIGDAAHLNNPLGGFGMNSGIHDAWNLADKLGQILLDGGDAEALLDRFDRQRRIITHDFIQAQTIANKKALGEAAAEREALFSRLEKDPAARRDYLLTQAMIRSLEDAEAIA